MLHTSFKVIGEDFLRFSPYMGMTAILVMWPGPFEQTFVPPSHGDSIWNLASTGPVVSEKKMFKECEQWQQTDNGAYLYYKLTYEPTGSGDLKMGCKIFQVAGQILNRFCMAFHRCKSFVWYVCCKRVTEKVYCIIVEKVYCIFVSVSCLVLLRFVLSLDCT